MGVGGIKRSTRGFKRVGGIKDSHVRLSGLAGIKRVTRGLRIATSG